MAEETKQVDGTTETVQEEPVDSIQSQNAEFQQTDGDKPLGDDRADMSKSDSDNM